MTDPLIDALAGLDSGEVRKEQRATPLRKPLDEPQPKRTARVVKALGERAGLTPAQLAELSAWLKG